MRTIISLLALSGISLYACPDIDKAARKYISENFSGDEEKPQQIGHKILPVSPQTSAVQIMVPNLDVEEEPPQPIVLFFSGKNACEFVYQAEGEMTETLEAGATRYVFIRHEGREVEAHYADYQVLRVAATGEVEATRDQHGQEILLDESLQKRCNGKVGNMTVWSRDTNDAQKIILRLRHTERDGKCRVTEDSSTYRYYRLTPDRWELDEGEDAAVSETEDPPATTPTLQGKRPIAHRR